ncbi:hypothetical protein [Tengunoibacter tsumagoiensis]|uniref:Uncharacterized protein n=1 Tax=Tengunoibacter tsumagoiensis TaxID=2014871 RepID=A0A402A1S0_9CHLR|nr:hypothetical protein [Tengunoibacter tsumagoiensis]GCE13064.1 hypothetical protein KTT_29230 [Tengunoibacter tsumagoiensis]
MSLTIICFYIVLILGSILYFSGMKIEKDKSSPILMLRIKDEGSSLKRVVSFIIMDIGLFGVVISGSLGIDSILNRIGYLSILVVFVFRSYKFQYELFSNYIKIRKKD